MSPRLPLWSVSVSQEARAGRGVSYGPVCRGAHAVAAGTVGLSPPECGFRVRFGVVRAGAFVVAALTCL
jgi:hypothetical protein